MTDADRSVDESRAVLMDGRYLYADPGRSALEETLYDRADVALPDRLC
jgi:hypothetical protein